MQGITRVLAGAVPLAFAALTAVATDSSAAAVANGAGPAGLKPYNHALPAASASGGVAKSAITGRVASKLDPALSRIAAAPSVNGESGLTTLRAGTPNAKFRIDAPNTVPSVRVEMRFTGDAAATQVQLQRLGMTHLSVFANRISGWLPTNQLKAASGVSAIQFIHTSMARRHAGSVLDQGDFVQRSDALRASSIKPGLLGSGITVGILSDSFDCLATQGGTDTAATDVATGDLPADYQVLSEDGDCTTGTDEGRAMAQIVHDVAPGAAIRFYSAFNGEADFANGIVTLAAAGAQVIVDDISYFDEPYFQDGIVSQAVDQVKAQGVAYFSSAGNESRYSWEGPFTDSGVAYTNDSGVNEELMAFGTNDDGSPGIALPFVFPANADLPFVLEWDDPFVYVANGPAPRYALDLCLGAADGSQVFFCTGPNGVGDDPVRILGVTNGDSDDTVGLYVGITPPSNETGAFPLPSKVKLTILGNGYQTTILEFDTQSGTIQGHPGAAGASAVGASYFRANPVCLPAIYPQFAIEDFSSSGGTPILFNVDGTRLSAPLLRQKPNFVAPDDGANTFFGGQIGARTTGSDPRCYNAATVYNFAGTSAAAPHAAGVAALLLQAQPKATPDVIQNALQSSTRVDIGRVTSTAQQPYTIGVNPTPNVDVGYGFIQADAALPLVLPAVTLSPASLAFGSTPLNSSTATQTATLTNSGGTALTISSITDAPDYTETNTCPKAPSTLAAGASCTFTVAFTPKSKGVLNESIAIASDAPGSPAKLLLTGTGTNPSLTLLPAALNFRQEGTTASGFTDPQTIVVASVGDSPVNISGITISGPFAQTNDCPATLASNVSCTITVRMSTALDSLNKSGSVSIASDSPSSPNTASLTGQIVSRDHGSGAMPAWLLLPALAAWGVRRRKRQ